MFNRQQMTKKAYLGFIVAMMLLVVWLPLHFWTKPNPTRDNLLSLLTPLEMPSSSQNAVNPKTGATVVIFTTRPGPFRTAHIHIRALGPEVFPYLNEYALSQESKLAGLYRDIYPKIPQALKRNLAPPPPQDLLSARAMIIIDRVGPVAARACSEAVLKNVSHSTPSVRHAAAHAFWWLLPDSDPALDLFLDQSIKATPDLLNWKNWSMLERKWSQDFPQRLQITNLLKHPPFASPVILALGEMGTPASPAVPQLIEMLEKGILATNDGRPRAIPYEKVNIHNENRRSAAVALVKIAPSHSDVLKALFELLNDEEPTVRAAVAYSLSNLKVHPSNLLQELLKSLQDTNLRAWQAKMRAIGQMGERAISALPDLEPFTSEEFIKTWFKNLTAADPIPLSRTHLLNMKLTASVAIGRIHPDQAKEHLPFIVEAIGLHGDPVQFLKKATILSNDIIPLVEPYLLSPVERKQVIAADIILHHDRNHIKAVETLKRRIEEDSLNQKIVAANYLSQATGSMDELIPLLRTGLSSRDYANVSEALEIIEKLDMKKLGLTTNVQGALWHSDRHIQQKAFFTLLDQAPEALPPIVE